MNIFNQLFKSLYSPKDLAQFRLQGIGKTILFVFFLTLLSVIPSTYYSSTAIVNGLSAIQDSVENELPSFTIENGELQTDLEKPKIINKDVFTIIFDSTGTVNEQELSNSENTVAFLKNDAYFVTAGQVQTFSYDLLTDITITNENLMDLLATVDSSLVIIIPLLALVIYIFAVGLKFIEISVLAVIGLLLKNLMVKDIQYRHTWRLAAYAVTLPTIFFTIMDALRTFVPSGWLIHWFVAFMMLFLAIKEIPQSNEK